MLVDAKKFSAARGRATDDIEKLTRFVAVQQPGVDVVIAADCRSIAQHLRRLTDDVANGALTLGGIFVLLLSSEQSADGTQPVSGAAAIAATLGAALGAGPGYHPARDGDAAILHGATGMGCAWAILAEGAEDRAVGAGS